MEYITVQETADKWNVSERLVQKYCVQGRIDGVKKFGRSWGIPIDAVKPSDLRKNENDGTDENLKRQIVLNTDVMPLMNTPFEPGHCMDFISRMPDGPKKNIAIAEYHYFSGHPEEAAHETSAFLTHEERDIRLSACLIYAYSNLSIGNINHAQYALDEVKNMLATAQQSPGMKATLSFVSATAAVLLHLPLPEQLPSVQEYLQFLPTGIRMFALYVNAHYLYLQKEYQKSLGIVEATLAMQHEQYPIPVIYLHLVAVMNYMSLKQTEKAREHLLEAWEIARPDDLIEGFGEHHGLLGGMLESVIKKEYPEDFKRIIAITYRFSAGWRKIHNPYTGHDVADNLTTTEFAVAMLAARGWTNGEIGDHMNISVNTVKSYISTVLQKLNITSRKELKKYMLR